MVTNTLYTDLYSLVLDVSSPSSKQLIQPASPSFPHSKLAAIQVQAATSAEKGDSGSHKEGSISESITNPFHTVFSILIQHQIEMLRAELIVRST
jgi:hypothetical protein